MFQYICSTVYVVWAFINANCNSYFFNDFEGVCVEGVF